MKKIKRFEDSINEKIFSKKSKEFEKQFKKLVNEIINNFNINNLQHEGSIIQLRMFISKKFIYKYTDQIIIKVNDNSIELNNEDITDLVDYKDIKKLYNFIEEKYNSGNKEVKNYTNNEKIKKIRKIFSDIFDDDLNDD